MMWIPTNEDMALTVHLRKYASQHFPPFFTGSRAIVGYGNDTDIAILYSDEADAWLVSEGFTSTKGLSDPRYPNMDLAATYRKGEQNVIAMRDAKSYIRERAATQLATHLHLTEKPQRVALFQYITEGEVRGTGIFNPDFN